MPQIPVYILTVYLQFRTNLTMYLLALMIYLVTIVRAKKKKGTNDFFQTQTRINKILQNIDNIAFKTKRFRSLNCYFKSHAIKIKYIFLLSILIKKLVNKRFNYPIHSSKFRRKANPKKEAIQFLSIRNRVRKVYTISIRNTCWG